MKIAVTYNNGEIFQHFGHTEEFMIYEIENGDVVNKELIGSNGSGHSALAELLDNNDIDVLICGGIGGGAQAALLDKGIELCAGATGDADEAVELYLRGELINTGANCDHHGEGHSCGEHGCGSDEDAGCGSSGGCGSGCGGCHCEPMFEGPNVGKKVRTHYTGTFNDGEVFDSSYDRGEPLEFVCGLGMMIQGFDKAVATMNVGDIVNVHLMPEEAYGEADPEAIFTIDINQMEGANTLEKGEKVYLQNIYGQPFPVVVADKTETTITFDANHEMAGKELNFKIELVEVVE